MRMHLFQKRQNASTRELPAALCPKVVVVSMWAAVGTRWHLVRHHLHAKDLVLCYSTTEDCLADLGTKRLARKILARFVIIFFNCLSKTWNKDPDHLEHICGAGVFAELD